MTWRPIVSALVLAALVAAGIAWYRTRASEPARPTDQALRELAHARSSELGELRALIAAEPKLTTVGRDRIGDCWKFSDGWSCNGFHPANTADMLAHVGLAADRWEHYRTLLARVDAMTIARLGDGEISIDVFARGLGTSGETKGLVWSTRPPSPLVADTDRDRPTRYATTYAEIGDGWYVEHATN